MWYFSWVLGVGLAVAFAVLNGLWHELRLSRTGDHGELDPDLDA
jgi:cyd operon protein YbgT